MGVSENSIYVVYPIGASDFPHSRQEVLDRGVINPQNGHILCDAKPGALGVSDANCFETDAVMEASRLRKRSRNRRKTCSISDPPSFFLPMHGWSRYEASGRSALEEGLPLSCISAKLTMTCQGSLVLCKIAHSCTKGVSPRLAETGQSA